MPTAPTPPEPDRCEAPPEPGRRPTRWLLRGLALLLALPVLASLSGLTWSPAIARLEHLAVTRLMGRGYALDELLRWLPLPLAATACLALTAAWALAGSRAPRHPALRLGTALLALVQAGALGLVLLLGWALQPGCFVLAGAGLLVAGRLLRPRPGSSARQPTWRDSVGPALLATLCLVGTASLLATHSEGTLWDQASNAILHLELPALLRQGLALGLFAAALGAGLWARRCGAPWLPDPAAGLTPFSQGLAPWAAIGLAIVGQGLLVDVPDCSSQERPGIRLLRATPPGFAIAASERGHLAVVQREQHLIEIIDVSTGSLLRSIPVEGGEPEDVIAVPGSGDYVATVVVDGTGAFVQGDGGENASRESMRLLHVDGETLQEELLVLPELCWASSMLWDPDSSEILLGCEDRPWLYRYRPAERSLGPALRGLGWGDGEDLALDRARERILTAPLMHSDRVAALSRESLEEEASAGLGGMNYGLVLDEATDLVFVSRLYDGVVVVLAAEDLQRRAVIRAGFGVRPLELFSGRSLLAAGSMFHSDLLLIDTRSLEVTERLQLGGRTKGLAADSGGRFLYLSSVCGVLEVDLEAERGAGS